MSGTIAVPVYDAAAVDRLHTAHSARGSVSSAFPVDWTPILNLAR
jgi:hypothetical protein